MSATWTKTDTIITLTSDTLMSDLINWPEDTSIQVADGDTININGFELTVDADASAIIVKISNNSSGSLKLIDNGYFKTSAIIPSTVVLSSDIKNTTGPYVSNASAVFHSEVYTSEIYNGTPHFRTVERFPGNTSWFAKIVDLSETTIKFDRDISCITGDILCGIGSGDYPGGRYFLCKVDTYNSNTFSATISNYIGPSISYIMKQYPYIYILSAPLLIRADGYINNASSNPGLFKNGLDADELAIYIDSHSGTTSKNQAIASGNINCKKLCYGISVYNNIYKGTLRAFSNSVNVNVEKLGSLSLFGDVTACGVINIGTAILAYLYDGTNYMSFQHIHIKTGNFGTIDDGYGYGFGNKIIVDDGDKISSFWWFPSGSIKPFTYLKLKNKIYEYGGTVSFNTINNGPLGIIGYHAPTTALDTTFDYKDYTIMPNKKLFIKCTWKRYADNSNAKAYVAITNLDNWYPPLKLDAYVETIFDSSLSFDWHNKIISYENDSNEPLQVRVWECVTGSTDGGYLKVETASGGPF